MPKGIRNEPLSDEEIDFILHNYKGIGTKLMARLLTERSGKRRSADQTRKVYSKYHLDCETDGRFKKGVPGWNKGMKIEEFMSPLAIERMKKTQFKKNHVNDNARPLKPIGAKATRSDGYVWVKIGQPNKWREEHRLVWEKANGPLKRYQKLIHIDGNRANNALDNLMTVSNAESLEINRNLGLTDDRQINLAVINLARIRCKVRKSGRK